MWVTRSFPTSKTESVMLSVPYETDGKSFCLVISSKCDEGEMVELDFFPC